MPNSIFIVLAALMVIGAIALIVWPLVRRGDPSPIAAGAIVAVMPLAAILLYLSYSNWKWEQPQLGSAPHAPAQQDAQQDQAASLEEVVTRLEQRLRNEPDDIEGWQMLGRSYSVLSRYADAAQAYGRARDLSGNSNVNALTGYAEALAMVRGGVIDGEIDGLFEQALQLDPDDRKALWYGGLAAFEQGRPRQARTRWQRLLDLDPPEQMVAVLREQIAAAEAAIGDGAVDVPVQQETAPVRPVVTAAVDGLALTVSIAPELAARARPDAPVFILARQVNVPGPPLAVVRKQVSDLPLQLTLSDANAMSPGQVLSAHETVEIVARVSLGGTPTAQSGDLSGSQVVASSGNVAILIDTVVR